MTTKESDSDTIRQTENISQPQTQTNIQAENRKTGKKENLRMTHFFLQIYKNDILREKLYV